MPKTEVASNCNFCQRVFICEQSEQGCYRAKTRGATCTTCCKLLLAEPDICDKRSRLKFRASLDANESERDSWLKKVMAESMAAEEEGEKNRK